MKTFNALTLLSSLLLSTVTAQYAIDPNSVSNSTKQTWCSSQQAQCPLICLQTSAASSETQANSCDPATLTYACVCSNGLSPNVSEYSQTLPYFICTQWGTECVANCGSDNTCQSNCRTQHPCGALNPTRVNTSTISTMSSTSSGQAGASTGSQGVVYTGYGGSAASSTVAAAATASGNGAAGSIRAAALGAGRTFGTLGVMGLLFGGFAVLL